MTQKQPNCMKDLIILVKKLFKILWKIQITICSKATKIVPKYFRIPPKSVNVFIFTKQTRGIEKYCHDKMRIIKNEVLMLLVFDRKQRKWKSESRYGYGKNHKQSMNRTHTPAIIMWKPFPSAIFSIFSLSLGSCENELIPVPVLFLWSVCRSCWHASRIFATTLHAKYSFNRKNVWMLMGISKKKFSFLRNI